jgi:hypothetical protein
MDPTMNPRPDNVERAIDDLWINSMQDFSNLHSGKKAG